MLPTSQIHGVCELCQRGPLPLTRHHLLPKSEGGRDGPLANLCAACHRQIHVLFSNEQLRELRTLGRLRDHPDVQRYLSWVRRQPAATGVQVRRPRRG